MNKNRRKNGKKLRLLPLVLGVYAIMLGLGLFSAAVSSLLEGVAALAAFRLLAALAFAGLGLYGVWDGIRDLFVPEKPKPEPPRQYILNDVRGQRSSNVTVERLCAQLEELAETEEAGGFVLTALPPLPLPGLGELCQIFVAREEPFRLVAFVQASDGSKYIRQKTAGRSAAEQALQQFLSGNLDLSDWKNSELTIEREEKPGAPRQLLRIWGESWRNDLKFFSVRDVELAIDGIAEGKYQKIELTLGAAVFFIAPSLRDESQLTVLLMLFDGDQPHEFLKNGTSTQVKFWLVRILSEGGPVELYGWQDITNQST